MGFHVAYRYRAPALLMALALAAPAQNIKGKVVRIMDGDTLELQMNKAPLVIRLNGVDAPEIGQMFGARAKEILSTLVLGKEISVVLFERERYNRIVADVFLSDGRNLSQELVRGGVAWWFRRYAPRDERLRLLEEEAREAKRGLWADQSPMPPWEYRKLERYR